MKKIFKIQNLTFIILIMALPLLAAPFTDRGNGTVLDRATNLVWQKCSMGLNNDSACSGTATMAIWADALTYCNTLTLAGRTWHLPNINELKSIADRTITPAPAAIDNTVFPATVASYYWSTSTFVPTTTVAWFIDFNDGSLIGFNKANSYYVRCVASGP